MPDVLKKQDMRAVKVEKALSEAMLVLLRKNKFGKITVNALCAEARVSRATFYAHYADKYNMLECWLPVFLPYIMERDATFEQAEAVLNSFVCENERLLMNLIDDADGETLDIVGRYILRLLDFGDGTCSEHRLQRVVLSSFYSGGIICYIKWLIKHKFPEDVPTMNSFVFSLIGKLRELETIERSLQA